jgi:hypothetical protein
MQFLLGNVTPVKTFWDFFNKKISQPAPTDHQKAPGLERKFPTLAVLEPNLARSSCG